jgi:DnaA family protein
MMQQLVLDMGLPAGPSLQNFSAGSNEAALAHLRLWLGHAGVTRRSPVPTYLWGGNACGKTHLLKAIGGALQEQGTSVGWLDAGIHVAPEFDESWACVLMDDVHAFSTAQQQ